MYFKLVNGDFLIFFSPFLTRCLCEKDFNFAKKNTNLLQHKAGFSNDV